MAEKNNATCAICGNGYYMCASCKEKMSATPWKIHTDTSEHYKVFQIVRGYSIGVYDKNEAKIKFQNVDLSDLDTFKPEIKKIVKDIMNYEEAEKPRSFNRRKEVKVSETIENIVEKPVVEVDMNIERKIVESEETEETEISVSE